MTITLEVGQGLLDFLRGGSLLIALYLTARAFAWILDRTE